MSAASVSVGDRLAAAARAQLTASKLAVRLKAALQVWWTARPLRLALAAMMRLTAVGSRGRNNERTLLLFNLASLNLARPRLITLPSRGRTMR